MWSIQITTTQKFLKIYFEEQASQSSVKVIAARSKAKAKPQNRELVELPSTIPMNERKRIDIEPAEPSHSANEVSKKVINLLRHNQTLQQEDDGAIQFWRINFIVGINFHKANIGRMSVGKFVWLQEEDQKEDICIVLLILEQFFTSVLFRDTPDVISLILCYKTMQQFSVDYFITSTTSDVRSIFIQSSTMD